MTPDTLEAARFEATRFLALARKAKIEKYPSQRLYIVSDPKLTGALRRASMDLTRALAEMRRP
jgi:ribosomal protein L16/L10AE